MEETAASHPSLSLSLTFDEWRGMRFHLAAPYNKQSLKLLFELEEKSKLKVFRMKP